MSFLRTLFHARTSRPGTLPAGLVLVVVAGALVVSMLVNADATLRNSQAKRNNPAWRTDVARKVADVSDALGLTAPRPAIDDAMGRHSSNLTPEQVLARQRAAQAAQPARADQGPRHHDDRRCPWCPTCARPPRPTPSSCGWAATR